MKSCVVTVDGPRHQPAPTTLVGSVSGRGGKCRPRWPERSRLAFICKGGAVMPIRRPILDPERDRRRRAAPTALSRKFAAQLLPGGLRRQVVQLARIFLQVKELEAVAGGIPDQLVAPVMQHPRRLGAGQRFAIEVYWCLRSPAMWTRPFAGLRYRQAAEIEQGRHDVLEANETDRQCVPPRPASSRRHRPAASVRWLNPRTSGVWRRGRCRRACHHGRRIAE